MVWKTSKNMVQGLLYEFWNLESAFCSWLMFLKWLIQVRFDLPQSGLGSPFRVEQKNINKFLFFVGYWLLGSGYWKLAVDYWRLAIGYWLLSFSIFKGVALPPTRQLFLIHFCKFPNNSWVFGQLGGAIGLVYICLRWNGLENIQKYGPGAALWILESRKCFLLMTHVFEMTYSSSLRLPPNLDWGVHLELNRKTSTIFCFLSAIGYWVVAIGNWLLTIGGWRLAIGYWLLANGYWRIQCPSSERANCAMSKDDSHCAKTLQLKHLAKLQSKISKLRT